MTLNGPFFGREVIKAVLVRDLFPSSRQTYILILVTNERLFVLADGSRMPR